MSLYRTGGGGGGGGGSASVVTRLPAAQEKSGFDSWQAQ